MLYVLYQLLILKQVWTEAALLSVHFVPENKQQWHYLNVYIEKNKEVKFHFSRMKLGGIICRNTMLPLVTVT